MGLLTMMISLQEIKRKAEMAVDTSDAYLTSFLCQIDSENHNSQWIVHFYDQLHDTMYSYDNENSRVQGPLEIFKEQDFVPELDLDDVKVSFEDAVRIARENALPGKDFKRIIIILQTIEDVPIWNITLLSASFHALNVRIDARDGNMIRKEPIELFEHKK
jgi:uncharacterized membrane protein YkoI